MDGGIGSRGAPPLVVRNTASISFYKANSRVDSFAVVVAAVHGTSPGLVVNDGHPLRI